MNTVARHKRYAEDLTKLVKDSKEETRRKLLDRLSLLASKAGENPMLFLRLVTADRKNMMRTMLPLLLKRKKQAEELGRQFGKDRANGKP